MAIPQTPSPLSAVVAAKTYNAQWFSGSTPEAQITAAIAAAMTDGAKYVFVPANMLPYNASLVTFNSAIRMVREGGNLEWSDVRAYGAAGDGATDDTAAIAAAIQGAPTNKGLLYFPEGTYGIKSPLDLTGISKAFGTHWNTTSIKPLVGYSGTYCIRLASGTGITQCLLEFLTIDGANTTNVEGVQLGSPTVALDERIAIKNCLVQNFLGASACGIRVYNVVAPLISQCYVKSNNIAVKADASQPSFPNLLAIEDSELRQSTLYGLSCTTQAFGIYVYRCKIEANGNEGVYIVPTVANAVTIRFKDCWFESNYGNNAAQYQFRADGSAPGVTVELRIADCYFNGTAGVTAKAMTLIACSDYVLDNVRCQNGAGQIATSGNGVGRVVCWPSRENGALFTTLADSNQQVQAPDDGSWSSFTPALTGGGTLAISNLVVATARYKLVGKLLYLTLSASFTISTSNSNTISLTLPASLVAARSVYMPTYIIDGTGTGAIGLLRAVAATSSVFFYTGPAAANWSNGASADLELNTVIEIQ